MNTFTRLVVSLVLGSLGIPCFADSPQQDANAGVMEAGSDPLVVCSQDGIDILQFPSLQTKAEYSGNGYSFIVHTTAPERRYRADGFNIGISLTTDTGRVLGAGTTDSSLLLWASTSLTGRRINRSTDRFALGYRGWKEIEVIAPTGDVFNARWVPQGRHRESLRVKLELNEPLKRVLEVTCRVERPTQNNPIN